MGLIVALLRTRKTCCSANLQLGSTTIRLGPESKYMRIPNKQELRNASNISL
jgi:hypothetical protein